MSKVKLRPLDHYAHSCRLDIRVSDLNYGAHLGYDRVLGLVHHARVLWLKEHGLSETDLGDGATGLVVTDVIANYLGEGFVGDPIEIAFTPCEVRPLTFRLAHRLTNADTGKPVALVEIGFVGFDYAQRTAARLPDRFIALLHSGATP